VDGEVNVEDDLERRDARYDALLAYATDLISILGPDGELLYQSPAGASAFGYERDTFLGTSVFELLHPDDYDKGIAAFRAVLDDPSKRTTVEIRFRRGDGLWAVGECTTTNRLHDPVIAGIVVNTRDVTERAHASAALRDSERRFRAVFEGSDDAMLLTDDDVVVVDANRAACQLLGREREDLIGRRADEIGGLPATHAERGLRELMVDGRHEADWPLVRPDGERRVVESRATANILPGQHLSILRDVTERRALEEQLRQAQKMEAIGRLAGGVAHDFNNLLTAISGYAALCGTAESISDIRESTDQIQRAADRGAGLIRQLLAFSRQQTLHPTVVDVNDLVQQAVPMLRVLVGSHIDFQVDTAPALRPVIVDPGSLEMILMNLVLNAAHAMPRGGTVTVSTEDIRPGEPSARVALHVTDTGHGMDEETVRRAFDPFFTTKEPGTGTGLGLATVHGIVTQSGGDARIESWPGEGTTVTVCLPATDEEPRPAAVRTLQPFTGGGSTLVVDDDELVRTVTAAMLESHGYTVTIAANPAEAIDLVGEGLRPDVVVSDMVMPRLSGTQLAEQLRTLAPDTRFVLMSGDLAHALRGESRQADVVYLDKPFSAGEIAAAVRQALEGGG
jgi:two-component system cell cycle sensor histidine kinase/response regulator CckA